MAYPVYCLTFVVEAQFQFQIIGDPNIEDFFFKKLHLISFNFRPPFIRHWNTIDI